MLCFNPRTREGCDTESQDSGGYAIVSIHAPVKGAMPSHGEDGYTNESFNPRTREGCDFGWWKKEFTERGFNPRTREGCDSHSDLHGDLA